MNNKRIEWRKKKLEHIRYQLESGQLNVFRELLPNKVIQQACKDSQFYFRTHLLTPLVTVFHMIGATIIKEGSFQSAWPMSGYAGQTGALSRARKRLLLEVWQRIGQWILNQVDSECQDKENKWRGRMS